jgi:hypothetical protein
LTVDGVKGSRRLKKNKSKKFKLVNCKEKIVLNAKKSGFCVIKFSVGRLKSEIEGNDCRLAVSRV